MGVALSSDKLTGLLSGFGDCQGLKMMIRTDFIIDLAFFNIG